MLLSAKTVVKLSQCFISKLPKPIKNPEIKHTEIFINNEWCKSISGKTFKTVNPTDGKTIAEVQHGGKDDVDAAVEAACEAFRFGSAWRHIDASIRGRYLFKLANLMEKHAVYLASLETLDNGKPFSHSYLIDVPLSIRCLRYMAGWADKIHGKVIPMDGKYFAYTRHEPVGICGQIIPWNFPLLLLTWKIGPALACGNTVVLKPSEQTSLTALFIASLAREAEIPPGVLNVVPGGDETGSYLVANPCVDKLAFTGSTEVGLLIQQASGIGKLRRTSLELGGKSPCIVLADADLENAVAEVQEGCFFNQGQTCCAGSRVYVQAEIYQEFIERSVERAKKRVVGDPFDEKTVQGPQIDEKQMIKILKMIKSGERDGADLVLGGKRIGKTGYFIQPTIFADVYDDMTFAREEIFGPVQQIFCFKTVEEVARRANDTKYGLAAGVFSKDMDKINYLVQAIDAGTIWVNTYNAFSPQTPFGGYKDSGFGRDMSEYGLKQYSEVKTVIQEIKYKSS